MVVVSSVSDLPEGAIRLQQGIFSFHDITVTVLVLGLVVTSMGVLHGVRVLIFGVSLWKSVFSINAYFLVFGVKF